MDAKTRQEVAQALIVAANTLEGGDSVSADAAAQIAKLTQQNHHSEAMAKAAEAVRDKKLAAAFRGVEAIAAVYGELPHDLSKIRYDLYTKRLKPQLQKKAPEILQAL